MEGTGCITTEKSEGIEVAQEFGDEEVIDLSAKLDEDPGLKQAVDEGRNSDDGENSLNGYRIAKVVNVKRFARTRMKLIRDGFAEKVHISCFSHASKKKLMEYIRDRKMTYVAPSRNPGLGLALYAKEDISAGQ